jgi:hypothetical protein
MSPTTLAINARKNDPKREKLKEERRIVKHR